MKRIAHTAAPPHFTIFLILGCGRMSRVYIFAATHVHTVDSVRDRTRHALPWRSARRICTMARMDPIAAPSIPPPPIVDPALRLSPPSEHRSVWLAQVGVMLAIAVLPDIAGALYANRSDAPHGNFYALGQSLRLAFRSLSVCAALMYIIWRSNEGWAAFGMTRARPWRDLGIGTVVWMAAWFASASIGGAFATVFGKLWGEANALTGGSTGNGSALVLLPALAANSVAEELALWGFLSTRLKRLGWSPALAILTTSTVFASYHMYQSSTAVVMIVAVGLVHGLAFKICKSIWPLVVSHTLQNLVAYLYWR